MCNIVLHVHRIFIYECQSYRPGFHDTETTEQDTISQWGGGGGPEYQYHRIKTHRRSTRPEKHNHSHAMIRHQNADAIALASALMRGIPPERPPFLISGG